MGCFSKSTQRLFRIFNCKNSDGGVNGSFRKDRQISPRQLAGKNPIRELPRFHKPTQPLDHLWQQSCNRTLSTAMRGTYPVLRALSAAALRQNASGPLCTSSLKAHAPFGTQARHFTRTTASHAEADNRLCKDEVDKPSQKVLDLSDEIVSLNLLEINQFLRYLQVRAPHHHLPSNVCSSHSWRLVSHYTETNGCK
jgi:hypothetical protein